jgi:hypothetical protein
MLRVQRMLAVEKEEFGRYEEGQEILRKPMCILFPPKLSVSNFPALYLIALFRRHFENLLRNIGDTIIIT